MKTMTLTKKHYDDIVREIEHLINGTRESGYGLEAEIWTDESHDNVVTITFNADYLGTREGGGGYFDEAPWSEERYDVSVNDMVCYDREDDSPIEVVYDRDEIDGEYVF